MTEPTEENAPAEPTLKGDLQAEHEARLDAAANADQQQEGPHKGAGLEADKVTDPAQEWADVWHVIGGVGLAEKWPSLAIVYSEAECLKLQRKLNPIFERNGWNDAGALGQVGEYLAAGVALMMVAKNTRAAIAHDTRQQDLADIAQKQEAPKEGGQA